MGNCCKVQNQQQSVAEIQATTISRDVQEEVSDCTTVPVFTYEELRVATSNFNQILGKGKSGVIFKGLIEAEEVAIKVLNEQERFQGVHEWLAEVNYRGQFNHPNFVKLLGYCCEDQHRILVYEYMAGGSLDELLYANVCVLTTLSSRVKIALAAAKALAFLHGAERPVIYGDFKTASVLLDADSNIKLSDFGVARDRTQLTTRGGVLDGYAAREYLMTGRRTTKSDVYAFGVVLLELLVGKEVIDRRRSFDQCHLVFWVRPFLNQYEEFLQILDPRIKAPDLIQAVQKVGNLTYQCPSDDPKERPSMEEVVDLLQMCQDGTHLL